MTDNKTCIRKWNGKTLPDWGCCVSPEFHSFQLDFIKAMKKIAKTIGAEIINHSYGHYDVSGFFKKGSNYVYFSYSNGLGYGGRTHIILKGGHEWDCGCCAPLLIRSAKNEKDYTGGPNNFRPFIQCEELIEKLLNK